MAKAVFLATMPDGTVAQRTSQSRTYTHMVCGQRDYAVVVRNATSAAARKTHVRNGEFHLARLAGDPAMLFRDTPEKAAEEARKVLQGAVTAGQYADEEIARHLARIEKDREAGYYDEWCALTWCGSYVLAMKQLGQRGFSNTKIVEAKRA